MAELLLMLLLLLLARRRRRRPMHVRPECKFPSTGGFRLGVPPPPPAEMPTRLSRRRQPKRREKKCSTIRPLGGLVRCGRTRVCGTPPFWGSNSRRAKITIAVVVVGSIEPTRKEERIHRTEWRPLGNHRTYTSYV